MAERKPLSPAQQQFGNQNAKGCTTSGRPRTTSLPPEEMIKLGQEMVEWVQNHPDILHLSEWYSIEKMFLEREWEAFQQLPEFHPYYEKALKLVGRKYLDKNSNVREGVSQRWQRIYFPDIRKKEDQDHIEKLKRELEIDKERIELEAKAKASADANATEEQRSNHKELISAIKGTQSERKIEESKIKAAAKS